MTSATQVCNFPLILTVFSLNMSGALLGCDRLERLARFQIVTISNAVVLRIMVMTTVVILFLLLLLDLYKLGCTCNRIRLDERIRKIMGIAITHESFPCYSSTTQTFTFLRFIYSSPLSTATTCLRHSQVLIFLPRLGAHR